MLSNSVLVVTFHLGVNVLNLKEKCGVFGVYSDQGHIYPYLYWGMLAQNHRGQQSHGYATRDKEIKCLTRLGLVTPIQQGLLDGNIGVANIRYATSGPLDEDSLRRNAMPLHISNGKRELVISFNGNIVNVKELQERVGIDETHSDTYALAFLLLNRLNKSGSIINAVEECMNIIDGAFSVIGITDDGTLFAFKDPLGIKPLCYGGLEGIHAFSSESVGLDINGFEHWKELSPGELITINEGKVNSYQITNKTRAFCAFEYAYFSRPDSKFNGKYVYQARKDFGVALARIYAETAERCDVVISIPETANDAAYGFHVESGLPWDMATRRHRYMTQRAFIAGNEERKDVIVRKVNLLKSEIKGKNLAVIDDSIVRGDTTRANIRRFREAGAGEIHLFITYPKIIGPCFYGIDMSTYRELIGVSLTEEEIAEELGADSVNYLPIEEYLKATSQQGELCTGCITGSYPTPLANEIASLMRKRLEKGIEEKGRIYEV